MRRHPRRPQRERCVAGARTDAPVPSSTSTTSGHIVVQSGTAGGGRRRSTCMRLAKRSQPNMLCGKSLGSVTGRVGPVRRSHLRARRG